SREPSSRHWNQPWFLASFRCVRVFRPWYCRMSREASERVGPALAGADADDFLDRGHEDLAVADAAGAGGLLDGLDRALDLVVLEHDLQLHLGQEVDDIFGAAIELGVTLLA